jgi:hypothetical protein
VARNTLNMLGILKHLDRSNCGKCGLPSCTAFAALAARGQKNLRDCPLLSEESIRALAGTTMEKTEAPGGIQREYLEQVKEAFRQIDPAAAAERAGGTINGDRLSIQVMGKRFELDRQGNLASECHVNPWVHLPLLAYVTHGAGRQPASRWLPYRDLKQARDWERFFHWKCERGIKEIVDQDPDFFFDAMSLFSPASAGNAPGQAFSSADDAIVVYPMPKLPLLLAYWRADGEFESKLVLFFDASAEVNLGAEFIYLLTMGILEMFRRIFSTHGV